MKLEAIIFDLDGTLLDTLEDLADSCNGALNEAGLPSLPLEEYKMHIGSGARNLVSASFVRARTISSDAPFDEEDLDEAYIDRLLQSYRQIYARSWSLKTTEYAGVSEMLTKLREYGLKLAVLSNKPDDFTRLMVDHYFPSGTFDMVYGLSDEWPAKPEPDLALHICRQLNSETAKTALIGDSGSDMETALNAGMHPLGVLWGFRDAEELKLAGAEGLFSETSELVEFLIAAT